MNLTAKWALMGGAGLAALSLISGCKISECTETLPDGGTVKKTDCLQIESTVEYRDARLRVGGDNWSPGRSVSIANHNGPLKVALLDEGNERVQFSGAAFTRDTKDDAAKKRATDHLAQMADPKLTLDGSNIVIDAPGAGLPGYNSFDGYDLTVWIPKDFDSNITIVNSNGALTLYGADGTKSTDVTSHSITADNLRGAIKLNSEVGDISVSNANHITGTGNVVHTDVGKILMSVGSSDLAVSAKTGLGVVSFGGPWISPTVADTKLTGTATLGTGTSTLTVTTDNGDIGLTAQ